MLTANDIITSSDKYPERANHPECTDEVKKNAALLAARVSELLKELKVTSCKVSSGFRPSSVNKAIPNAAKRSLHMRGLAVDLVDKDGSLDKLLNTDVGQTLLERLNMWQEHPDDSPQWSHVDLGTRVTKARPGCGSRQFRP